jgi:hypothetical protein
MNLEKKSGKGNKHWGGKGTNTLENGYNWLIQISNLIRFSCWTTKRGKHQLREAERKKYWKLSFIKITKCRVKISWFSWEWGLHAHITSSACMWSIWSGVSCKICEICSLSSHFTSVCLFTMSLHLQASCLEIEISESDQAGWLAQIIWGVHFRQMC